MPLVVDKLAKRNAIIHHAADVFSKHGYHETRIQEIATAADIGKGTVYEYFRTKEELFLAVYDAWMTEYEAVINKRLQHATDAVAKVDAIRDSTVEFYRTRANQAPLLLEFWAHALRSPNPQFLERIQKTRLFLRELGVTLTQELIDAGWFTPVDVQSFSVLETGISDGIFLGWLLEGRTFPLEKAYTFRQSVIGMGLLEGDARALLQHRLSEKLKKGF